MITISKENNWGELLVGRHDAWPNWFSNQKLFLGREFEYAAKRRAQDGFDVDIHSVEVDIFKYKVIRLGYSTDIRKFVLTKLGDEPRKYYISKWLSELQKSPMYREELLAVVFDFESQTDEFSWNKDEARIIKQRNFLSGFLKLRENLPTNDLTEDINNLFPANDLDDLLYWATAWAGDPAKANPSLNQKIFVSYPKMLMDFWDRVAFLSPDLVGFMWGPVFLHESFVLKQGSPVVDVSANYARLHDMRHK